MLTVALIPTNKNTAFVERLHWHMRVLKQHNIAYQILDNPSATAIKHADIILRTDITYNQISAKKTVDIDPLMSPDIAGALNRIILDQIPAQQLATTHKARFNDWLETNAANHIQIFAPGPSGDLSQLMPDSLSFITGFSKVEEARTQNVKVDGIIISDSMALANSSPHAQRLISSIQELQKRHESVLITTLANAAILSAHWPKNLEHLLIGVPENNKQASVQSLKESFGSFPSGNVLTALILPAVLSLNAPVDLYGFDGLLRTSPGQKHLAHKDILSQNANKLQLFKYSFGGGLIFPDEYRHRMQMDADMRLSLYLKQGHNISAAGTPITVNSPKPANRTRIKAKFYTAAAFADNNRVLVASLLTLILAGIFYVGTKMFANTNTLLYALAIVATFMFLLGFLHLRTRAKRLADLAERKANEKAQRAFLATNQRLDALEKRLDN